MKKKILAGSLAAILAGGMAFPIVHTVRTFGQDHGAPYRDQIRDRDQIIADRDQALEDERNAHGQTQSNLAQAQRDIQTANQNATNLNNQLTDLRQDLARTQNDFANTKNALLNANIAAAQQRELITQMELQVDTHRQQIVQLGATSQNLATQLTQSNLAITGFENTISSITADRDELRSQIDLLLADGGSNAELLLSLQAELERMNTALSEVNKSKQAVITQKLLLTSQLSVAENDIATMTLTIIELNDTVVYLRNRLDNALVGAVSSVIFLVGTSIHYNRIVANGGFATNIVTPTPPQGMEFIGWASQNAPQTVVNLNTTPITSNTVFVAVFRAIPTPPQTGTSIYASRYTGGVYSGQNLIAGQAFHLQGFRDIMPVDEILSLFENRLETSEDFKALIKAIQSPEFSNIYNTLFALPELQDLLQMTRDGSLDQWFAGSLEAYLIETKLANLSEFHDFMQFLNDLGLDMSGRNQVQNFSLQDYFNDFMALIPFDGIVELIGNDLDMMFVFMHYGTMMLEIIPGKMFLYIDTDFNMSLVISNYMAGANDVPVGLCMRTLRITVFA